MRPSAPPLMKDGRLNEGLWTTKTKELGLSWEEPLKIFKLGTGMIAF